MQLTFQPQHDVMLICIADEASATFTFWLFMLQKKCIDDKQSNLLFSLYMYYADGMPRSIYDIFTNFPTTIVFKHPYYQPNC